MNLVGQQQGAGAKSSAHHRGAGGLSGWGGGGHLAWVRFDILCISFAGWKAVVGGFQVEDISRMRSRWVLEVD